MTVSRTIRARTPRIPLPTGDQPPKIGVARHQSHLTLLDPFEKERLQRACDRFLSSMEEVPYRTYKPRSEVLVAVRALRDAGSSRAFGRGLDAVFEAITQSGHRPHHALELSVRLWEEGCVLLPIGTLITGTACVFGEMREGRGYKHLPELSGRAGHLVEQAHRHAVATGAGAKPSRIANAMFWLLVTTQGIAEGASMTWDEARETYGVNRECPSGWHLMHALGSLSPPDPGPSCGDLPTMPVRNVRGRGAGTRSDPEFVWVTAADPTMEAWRAICTRWVEAVEGTQAGSFVTTGNKVLSILSELPPDCREPATLLATSHPHHGTVAQRIKASHKKGAYLVATLIQSRALFERALFELSRTSDGSYAVPEGLANPVPWSQIPPFPRRSGKTAKLPIPAEWVDELIKIIVEDDFAWPQRHGGDDFDAADGSGKMWSPVRALFVIALLSYQGRFSSFEMADSGEGDPWLPIFKGDEKTGTIEWVDNPLNTRRHPEPRGIMRRDSDGAHLYFTYNKGNPDYPSFWQNRRLFRLICGLRAWQAKYNPVELPLEFTKLTRSDLATRRGIEAQPPRYHLFRDPTNSQDRAMPVSHGRMHEFFLALLDELERRLSARSDSKVPVRLILKRSRSGKPERALFSLHATRATTVTHLERLGVPLEIISRETGHRSKGMTARYSHSSPSETKNALAKADAERPSLATEADFLADLAGREAARHPHADDPVSIVRASDRGGTSVRKSVTWGKFDYGLCPNGASLCATAVPGAQGADASSCLRCPHLLTGAAFVAGLAGAHAAAVRDASAADATMQAATMEMDRLEAADDMPASDEALRAADDALTAATNRSNAANKALAGASSHLATSLALLRSGAFSLTILVSATTEGEPVHVLSSRSKRQGSAGPAEFLIVRVADAPGTPRMQVAAALVAQGIVHEVEARPAVTPRMTDADQTSASAAADALASWLADGAIPSFEQEVTELPAGCAMPGIRVVPPHELRPFMQGRGAGRSGRHAPDRPQAVREAARTERTCPR